VATADRVESLVGVSVVVAAVAGENDVTASGPDPGVLPGNEIDVATITAESPESLRKPKPIPFGDPSRTTNIRPREVEIAVTSGSVCEVGQPLDSLCCDGHTGRSVPIGI